MPPKTDDERDEERNDDLVAATLVIALVQREGLPRPTTPAAIVSLHRQILVELRKPPAP